MKTWFLKVVGKISNAVKRVWAFLPSPLPIGMTDFNVWASSILVLYGFPDNDSTRGALAIMVTQLKPTAAWKSKRYFGLSVHVAAAKEVAGNFYYEHKRKYQEKAAQEKLAAATAPQVAVDVPASA